MPETLTTLTRRVEKLEAQVTTLAGQVARLTAWRDSVDIIVAWLREPAAEAGARCNPEDR